MKTAYKYISIIGLFLLIVSAVKPVKTTSFILDNKKSKVHWFCDHHIGDINLKEGNLIYKYNEPYNANFTIDMTSIIDTDIENKLIRGTLNNTLKSVFFDVENYPKAYFKTDNISYINDTLYKIKGDFVLFNAEICHEFNASIKQKNDSIYFTAKDIILDRTDWAIYYGSRNNPNPLQEEEGIIVSDTIKISVDMVLYAKN